MHPFTFRTFQDRVLEYAERKGLLPPIEKMSPMVKGEFLIELGMQGLVPKRTPVHLDTVISENMVQFLNWYFFEHEKEKSTIAERYVESQDFRKDFPDVLNAKKVIGRLRNPVYGNFIMVKKGVKDEYDVKKVEEDETYTIHDVSTFPQMKEGLMVWGKLYPFGEKWYIDYSLLVYPEETAKKYGEARAFSKRLRELFEEFIEAKNVSEKTQRKYEEMFSLLSEYVSEKRYRNLNQVVKLNVDTWARWMRKEWHVSAYALEECRSAVKPFLKFLSEKEKGEKK